MRRRFTVTMNNCVFFIYEEFPKEEHAINAGYVKKCSNEDFTIFVKRFDKRNLNRVHFALVKNSICECDCCLV